MYFSCSINIVRTLKLQSLSSNLRAITVGFILGLSLALPAFAQETVRPEVGKPLQAAQEMMKASRFKESLNKIREAETVPNKTAYETYLIERMRATAASGMGDNDAAIKSFEAVLASGKASAADQLKIIEALAGAYYRAKNYDLAIKSVTRYFREGGNNPALKTLLIQSYFLSNDFANAAKEALADIQADEKAGRPPAEEKLQLLANCYLKQKDSSAYVATIEKLLNYYPKKSLWADILSRLQKKPGFSDRLLLDVYRLQLATGNLSSVNDYMEMTQLSLQAGYSAEAKKIVDAGYSSAVLGKGNEAERHKRLRDLVDKQLAASQKNLTQDDATLIANKDGSALVALGFNQVLAGQTKGLNLMEAGIKKGGLKRPEDAKLQLGVAYVISGQKAKGIQTLKTVKGTDGVADLANLWVIFAQRS